MSEITINGITIDPIKQNRALRDAGLVAEDASESDHILIQTADPLTAEQRAELAGINVDMQEYVSDNTYLAAYPPQDLNQVRELAFVRWADVYSRVFKIPPPLLPRSADAASIRSLAHHQPHPDRRLQRVDLLLHPGLEAGPDLIARVAAAARVERDAVGVTPGKLRITTSMDQLPELAKIDEIREIHPVRDRQLFNNVARQILNAQVQLDGTTYRGDGEVVAVADTGFDTGDAASPHPAFTGRVRKLYALGRTAPDKADDPHGHGTHVAGSVLGRGNSATMGGDIEGTAPEAELILQSVLDPDGGLGGIPVNLNDLFQKTYDDGARVHTNSWGVPGLNLPYDASSREIDEFVWNHPDQVICFAAGNDGVDGNSDGVVDSNSIGSQSAAKNCITVGASESLRKDFAPAYGTYWPGDFPSNPVKRDKQANNPDGMVAFSSRGPTKEGRIKPDVVAPGTSILSSLSRNASMSNTFGTSTDPLFFFDSGTSMACPLVAGCAAVLRETLVKNGLAEPSAALVKALLINGADPLAGQYNPSEAGESPNGNSGWGRVNLARSVVLPGPPGNAGLGEGGPLEQGQEESFTLEIPGELPKDAGPEVTAAGVTLKITLVWSDPPGPLLQNDLDLIVIAADGSERHGNSGASSGFDRQNNVEQVVWTGMPAGEARIVIRAFRITQFAQPYAYVWRLS
ncbi:S8 family serine peptidase [Arthrobacter sp. ISL-72]|uniref:S8 family serine peptidase n=1 Tax=Arthrobacter sp. ISL-72 TaxID=2819114 RepID=UPI001BE9CC2B|nr:S8 family serine peptidase [Arthrobacter sp. ISL-72]MBT2596860.1 S8 family serine peptidase [Arthrobacter sp. ISL-72]